MLQARVTLHSDNLLKWLESGVLLVYHKPTLSPIDLEQTRLGGHSSTLPAPLRSLLLHLAFDC